MRIRSTREFFPLTERFAVRDKPRQIFWQHYHKMNENKNSDKIQVLFYYGIGGIGKYRMDGCSFTYLCRSWTKAFINANLKEEKAEYGNNGRLMKARYQTMGFVLVKSGQPKKAMKYYRLATKCRKKCF